MPKWLVNIGGGLGHYCLLIMKFLVNLSLSSNKANHLALFDFLSNYLKVRPCKKCKL